MANRCDINIRVIGDKDDIAAAERDLAAVFEGIWNYEDSYDLIVVTNLDGVVYQTWYPWNPPGERLEEDVFEKHPNLIFLTTFSEDGMGFRGRVAWAYGYEVGYAAGAYGPDGDELYDSIAPLPDIFAPWLSPETRLSPHEVAEKFKTKLDEIHADRAERKTKREAKAVVQRQRKAEEQARKAAQELRAAEDEALRVKREAELQAAEDAELALSFNGFTPPRPIEQVVFFLEYYPRLAYCDVAQKFNWQYGAMLQKLKETGQFDEARLLPRPDQPVDKALPPGRYTREQAETFFRERGQELPAPRSTAVHINVDNDAI